MLPSQFNIIWRALMYTKSDVRSPADRLGVATLSAGVQRAGGSVQHPMGSLDDALEFMAAYVEARGDNYSSVTTTCCRPQDVLLAQSSGPRHLVARNNIEIILVGSCDTCREQMRPCHCKPE